MNIEKLCEKLPTIKLPIYIFAKEKLTPIESIKHSIESERIRSNNEIIPKMKKKKDFSIKFYSNWSQSKSYIKII